MRKTNRIFTLIELLITVAVIAILAGLLLPALHSARNKALAIQCVSNMRQAGLQICLYADANNGFWPISKASVIQSGNWSKEVLQQLPLSAPLPKYFFCPSPRFNPSATANPDRYSGTYTYGIRGYRWAMDLGSEANLPFVDASGNGVNGTSGVVAFNPAKVKRPSAYQMIADSVNYSPSSDYYGMPYYFLKDSNSGGYHLIHQERATILLVDGHVESWDGARCVDWVVRKGGRAIECIRRENFQASL